MISPWEGQDNTGKGLSRGRATKASDGGDRGGGWGLVVVVFQAVKTEWEEVQEPRASLPGIFRHQEVIQCG